MKQLLLTLAFAITLPICLLAQNTFPGTGNAGIGTTSPQAPLHTIANTRNYMINKTIAGSTLDNTGINYILLHEVYNGTRLVDNHTFGTITGVRGNTVAWNRKWTVDVRTASSYESTMGNIVSYHENARLFLVTYNSVRYMAVQIAKNSLLSWFSFTGYSSNEMLTLVTESQVTDVTLYNPTAITIQGSLQANKLYIPDVVAIGGDGSTGTNKLTVDGTIAARKVKVTQATPWPDFVFADDYQLPALDSVEAFVKARKHLPGIPSEADVKKEGVDLGEINAKLLQKVEELTLYLIDIKKENAEMKKRLQKLESKQ